MNELARRVQRAHNRLVVPEAIARPGGLLAFSSAGDLLWVLPGGAGGLTEPKGCPCPMHRVAFRFPMRSRRVSITEARAFVAAALGTAPSPPTADLYGSTRRRPLEEFTTPNGHAITGGSA